MPLSDPISLIQELVALPGPPGNEGPVRDCLAGKLGTIGQAFEVDPKGNLLARVGPSEIEPRIIITAHMDEIGLIVTKIEADGRVRVAPYGGSFTWKWGEGAMEIIAIGGELIPAILSYGGIHTNHPASVVEHARNNPLFFDKAYLFTGKGAEELEALGVVAGVRAVLARSRRESILLGEFIGSFFIDDRADLAVWLMAIERLASDPLPLPVIFAATTYEEVGGTGSRYLHNRNKCDVSIALEIGPKTPEADFEIDAEPTIWVKDGYAAIDPVDMMLLREAAQDAGVKPYWQYLSRGGSDATCVVDLGLAARPVTLGLPVENSHGFEIMHRDAPEKLCQLLIAYLKRLCSTL